MGKLQRGNPKLLATRPWIGAKIPDQMLISTTTWRGATSAQQHGDQAHTGWSKQRQQQEGHGDLGHEHPKFTHQHPNIWTVYGIFTRVLPGDPQPYLLDILPVVMSGSFSPPNIQPNLLWTTGTFSVIMLYHAMRDECWPWLILLNQHGLWMFMDVYGCYMLLPRVDAFNSHVRVMGWWPHNGLAAQGKRGKGSLAAARFGCSQWLGSRDLNSHGISKRLNKHGS